MIGFWERFIGFRKGFAALAYDAFRAAREGTFPAAGRLLALFMLFLLVAVPATVLALGKDAFGNKLAFGIAFGLWPVILEAPGWWIRREDAARLTGMALPFEMPGFDVPMFALLTAVGVVVEVVAFYVVLGPSSNAVERGLLWGVGLAGALDFTRTAVAFFLANADGYPLYR